MAGGTWNIVQEENRSRGASSGGFVQRIGEISFLLVQHRCGFSVNSTESNFPLPKLQITNAFLVVHFSTNQNQSQCEYQKLNRFDYFFSSLKRGPKGPRLSEEINQKLPVWEIIRTRLFTT